MKNPASTMTFREEKPLPLSLVLLSLITMSIHHRETTARDQPTTMTPTKSLAISERAKKVRPNVNRLRI
jgi:hypothetical protein